MSTSPWSPVLAPCVGMLFAFTMPATCKAQWPEEWTQPRTPFRIAGNLHYVGSADLAAYLLTSENGHILIDVPMKENVAMIVANVQQLGFDPGDIAIQLASHAHFDHTGGLAPMTEITGAKLLLSKEDADLVARGGKGDFHLGDSVPYPPIRAHRTLQHLETVSVGDLRVTAHLTPGHTKGCTSWSGEVTINGENKTWVSVCSLTVLPGYRLVGENPSYPGIARDFCQSVQHLKSVEADLFLASHGSFIRLEKKAAALAAGDTGAFLDQEGYARYLDRALQRIEKTLQDQGLQGGCETVLAED